MNNLSSYCGLVDAKIRASDKDLPLYVKLTKKDFDLQIWVNWLSHFGLIEEILCQSY